MMDATNTQMRGPAADSRFPVQAPRLVATATDVVCAIVVTGIFFIGLVVLITTLLVWFPIA